MSRRSLSADEQRAVIRRAREAGHFCKDEHYAAWAEAHAAARNAGLPTPTEDHFAVFAEILADVEALLGEPAWDRLAAGFLAVWGFEPAQARYAATDSFWADLEEFCRSLP